MEYNKPRLNNPPAFISPASPRCITGVTAKQTLFLLGTWGFSGNALRDNLLSSITYTNKTPPRTHTAPPSARARVSHCGDWYSRGFVARKHVQQGAAGLGVMGDRGVLSG